MGAGDLIPLVAHWCTRHHHPTLRRRTTTHGRANDPLGSGGWISDVSAGVSTGAPCGMVSAKPDTKANGDDSRLTDGLLFLKGWEKKDQCQYSLLFVFNSVQ